MFVTGLIAILAAIAVVMFTVKFKIGEQRVEVQNPDTLRYESKRVPVYLTRLWGILPLALFFIALFAATFTTVEAKQVGVVTSMGKPLEQTLDSGPHLVAPWQKVTEIDATTQTDEYHGEKCIVVTLADKNTACISATNRWSVNDKNANDVYAEYRSDDPTKSLRDAVVSTQFKAALNSVFSTYDATDEKAADYDALAAAAMEITREKTKGLVDIDPDNGVTISGIKPSEKLQDKIEAIQAQEAKTRIATEAKATAAAEAAANRELASSLSKDPNVLVSKCLDIVAEGVSLPAGFSCMGGSGAVVVPSK